MPFAGQVVAGRYRLLRPLGQGGMAAVWEAEHLSMGTPVAIKVISPDLVRHPVAIARFKREASAAAALRSPHVVQIFDHDVDAELGPFIAMEVLEGESLAARLDRERKLPPPVVARVLLQVAKALMRAHAVGIVHRDLKPDNIYLVPDDEGLEIAKVLDFGVAKADSPLNIQEGKTAAGTLLGTLNYMSPEQAQGHDVDHRSDLWSMGVIAFEAIVGRRPFDEEAPGALVLQICAAPMPRPSEIDPDAPPGLDEWFAQAAAREPAARFQSALELARALLAVCDPEEAGALAEGRLTGQYPVLKPPAVSKSTDAASPRAEAASGERQAQRPPAPAPAPDAAQAKSPRRSSRPAKRRSERPASERSRDRRVLQIVPSVAPPKKRPKLQIIPSAPPGEIVMRERAPAAGGFFVMVGPKTSGPVSLEQLKTGVASGTTPASALVWTHGWPAWRSALEVLATSEPEPGGGAQSRPAQDDITHLAGKADLPHDAPPAVPKRRRGAETLPAPGSAVRQVGAGGPPLREPTYFLVDGAVSVGPVRASVLRRGIEQGRVPWSTMVWRAGLDRWVSPAEVLPEILAWDAAPPGELWGRPGLEAVGQRSLVPPAAPPTMAPRTRGRTK